MILPESTSASTPFARFAATADAVGATAKRLEKTALLAEYFAGLPDADLPLAVRWMAGRLFPLHDQRTVSVGPALLRDVIAAHSGLETDAVRAHLVRHGDLADVAREVWPEAEPGALTLAGVESALEELAALRGTKRKTEAVRALLAGTLAGEAKSLVGLLQGDLRIGTKAGGVEAALAKLGAAKVGAVKRAHMLTGDLGATALLARAGTLETARMQLFHPITFMLASPTEDAADALKQLAVPFGIEDKYDGIRAQAHIAAAPEGSPYADPDAHGDLVETAAGPARVALFSRTLDTLGGSFPDLLAPLAALATSEPGGLILDGEVIPVDPETGRVTAFQALQKRLGRKKPSAKVLAETPVAFVAYDALFAGEMLFDAPLSERQDRLGVLALPEAESAAPVRRSAVTVFAEPPAPEVLDEAFGAAQARGNEGLMLKGLASPYKPGRRGKDWLKLKRPLATLDVVVTSVEVGSGRRRKLLSDYTFAVRASESDDTLLNIGKAYSGLTDVELAEMTEHFEQHTKQQFAHGRVRVVEPNVVIEVAFDRVQPSPRHKSGYALRFPRIARLRPDKPVSEIDTLETVAKLAGG